MERLPSLRRSLPSIGEGGFGAQEGHAKAPLRVLVYGIHYAPEAKGPGRYTGELCAWLARRGHEVRAITAPPHYPDWRVQAGYAAYAYRREQLDGVCVYRCPLWVPREPSALRRFAHRLSFAVSSVPAVAMQWVWRPHVVMAMGPALLAWPLARLTAARTWLHVHDCGRDAADGGARKRAALAAMAQRVLMRSFDRVSANSESMLLQLSGRGVAAGRCVLFPNWVDCTQIYPLPGPSRLRREWSIPSSACVALYSGEMGQKDALECVIDAARQLTREPRLIFLLCGSGAARAPLQAATRGLHNVRWLPAQPPEKLNALLNVADVHLLPQAAASASAALPPELPALLASGRPMVAMGATDTALAHIAHSCGVVAAPQSGEVANALRQLLEHDIARRQLGAAARRYAEQHFHKDRVLGRFEEQLVSCVIERSERRVPPEVRSA
ncbi:MAG TPA: WcaI family glycosyltransferase [Burkholderiales bacterium]|nr:WcaI family glycosyltransferase [Burkholderiales bacterium]